MPQHYSENPPDVKYMEMDEFVREGYLSEINRRLLHPLGLALEVTVDPEGAIRFSGVWDCRHDPEGIVFDDALLPEVAAKAKHYLEKWRAVTPERDKALGFVVQPTDTPTG